ncbi:hypothetical protein UFOVP708_41 [uncultured Caudovirales phage]|uniref:Uncharacterized protein n=1 Tax=uncultured Caudovirales phage TaxID=2100421 RepID=A0A6J5NUU2_9CAUD|nr:hypothetical protein UFOVP708_41 [uncultured Caudovirales phage]
MSTIENALKAITDAAAEGSALSRGIKAAAPKVERPAPEPRKYTSPAKTSSRTYQSPKSFPVKTWEERLKESGRQDGKPYLLNNTDRQNLEETPVTKDMDFVKWLAECCLPRLMLGLDPDYEWASKLYTQRKNDIHRGGGK